MTLKARTNGEDSDKPAYSIHLSFYTTFLSLFCLLESVTKQDSIQSAHPRSIVLKSLASPERCICEKEVI